MQTEAERKVAERADLAVAERAKDPGSAFKFVPGKPLPDGFINPPCGEDLHRCVDMKNRYAPDWYAFNLHQKEGQQSRIPFGDGIEILKVKAGLWCDVPPKIVARVKSMVEEVMEMRPTKDPTSLVPGETGMVLTKVGEIPTFSYTAIKSS